MKKILFFIALFAFTLTGCKDERCVTTDYTIVNQIVSDIIVELRFGNRQVTTINPGETKMFHTGVQCYEEGMAPIMPPEILNAEMRIDGDVMPEYIWWIEYWNVDAGAAGDNYRSYTLYVTDELIETINNLPHRTESL